VKKPVVFGTTNRLVDPSGNTQKRMKALEQYVKPLKGYGVKNHQLVPLDGLNNTAVVSGHVVFTDNNT